MDLILEARWPRALVAIGLCWMAGCPEDASEPGPADGGLTCAEADLEASRELERLWSDPNICAADSECVLVDRSIICPEQDNRFGFCPYPVHASSTAAFEAVNARIADEVCPSVTNCASSGLCPAIEARCAAFECRAVVAGACLETCDALGCGECGARCLVEPTCVAAADTCDAMDLCTPSPVGRVVWAQPYDEAEGCFLAGWVVVGILDEPPTGASADLFCGVGPDGRPYLLPGSLATALGFPACSDERALTASFC